ncbi:MAG TPA: GNAT family N-acetyltransferase [Stellaceae bacterium]|nr:GNAT family N-acetyltransferase [Stellaceae bacterium]
MRETIFHEAWWYDIVAPGRWGEVRTERGYLRYAYRNRLMFRSCPIPPLTRIVGPVVQIEGKKMETRQRATFAAVCELLDQFPEFDSIRFRLDPSVSDVLPFQARGYQTSVQHTLQTDCRQSEEVLWSEMRDKTRNIIRRAQDSLSVIEIDDPEIFKRFYAGNLDSEKSYFDLDLLPQIFAAARARGCARILASVDPRGDIHAQTFFLWDEHSCYYFLSSRDQSVAHAGAVSQLMWAGMQHAHALGLTFDFDGVTSQARYQFLVGFGGQPATRFILSKGALLYDAQASARAFSSRLMGRAAASF